LNSFENQDIETQVGRIGSDIVLIDAKKTSGTCNIMEETLEVFFFFDVGKLSFIIFISKKKKIESRSNFTSLCADSCVYSGKWVLIYIYFLK